MPRPARIDYPGARHHVMNRGSSHGNIFDSDDECHFFLSILAGAVERFGIRIAAFVLMPNHYHLLVESVQGNLSSAMKLIGQEFTQGKNRVPGRDGPIFKGRFTSKLVTDPAHWFHLPFYLHLNPVKARLVLKPEQWEWSSRDRYAGRDTDNIYPFLSCSNELAQFGDHNGYCLLEQEILTGRRLAPEGLDTVLFGTRAKRTSGVAASGKQEKKDPAAAINEITQLTGCSESSLRTTIMGPDGNIPRVLAVWWLAYGYHQKNVTIARMLDMTQTAVAKTLARLNKPKSHYQNEQLREWIRTLELNGM